MDVVATYDDGQPNLLYHNNGDKTFTKVLTGAIVTDLAKSVSSTWGDYDNDGNLDLYVTNDQNKDNFLYRNDGTGAFTKVENGLTEMGGNSFGTAISDYDGDYDLFVANHEETTNFFFENTKGQWEEYLCMTLIGTNSIYFAIGTKVTAKATINGVSVWQMHEISSQTGGGAGAQNSM